MIERVIVRHEHIAVPIFGHFYTYICWKDCERPMYGYSQNNLIKALSNSKR